ncbi:hypothetical protein YC2023_020991 [Brassica napus]
MAPKRNEAESTADQMQQQMGRISLLEQSMTKVDAMEQTLAVMQQQMSAFFGRLEQEKNEQAREKARSLEAAKGKAHQEEETSVGEGSSPVTTKAGQVLDQTPISVEEEGSERKGAFSQGSSQMEEDYRNKRLARWLELPLFDGEQADSWVLRADQYFEISEFTEEQKLKAVKMCFVEDALLWYRWERDRDPFRSWSQLKERVLEQYSTARDTSAGERLLRLRQEGSVKDYCREFISLATNAPELTDAVLEMAFMNGLKPRIRAGVRMFEPKTLQKMMSLARKVEEWEGDNGEDDSKPYPSLAGRNPKPNNRSDETTNKLSFNGPNQQKSKPNYTSSLSPQKDKGVAGKTTTYHNRVKAPFRRLTPAEIEQRRSAGLCFRCDEKFFRNHKCPKPELTVLIMHDDGKEEVFDEEPCELLDEEENEVEAVVAEVSISSVVGLTSSRTMKLKGELGGEEVTVLIDSGASHNFISEKMASRMGLITKNTTRYGVMVAGGVKVQGRGVITGVELSGEWVLIQGDPSLHSAGVSLKSIWKTLEEEGEGIVVEFGGLTEVSELYAVSVSTALQLEEIGSEVDKDVELQKLITELREDPSKHPDYSWVQGRLLRQGKLVLPRDSPLVGVILKEHHDSKMAGHGGMLKTQKRLSSEGVLETEPAAVLKKRRNEKTQQEEVLVQWEGLPAHDCTWEEVSVMKDQFPQFDLEDKINFEGPGIDTYEAERPPILFHYRRRGQTSEK